MLYKNGKKINKNKIECPQSQSVSVCVVLVSFVSFQPANPFLLFN